MTARQFTLNEGANLKEARDRFSTKGRTQVKTLLTEDAAKALLRTIEQQPNWNAVFSREGGHVDLNAAGLQSLNEDQLRGLIGYLNQTARETFQYFFANIPLYDICHSGTAASDDLQAIFALVRSEAFLETCRQVTGFDDIAFSDAQVTRYGPGQFLTRHDDDVAGKNRRAAYVLNLTPHWRTEWGGLLEFYGDDGNVTEGFVPAFNTLNLFRVPQTHAVTYVTPFAGAYRYAITGWLRSGEDPKGKS